MTGSLEKTYKDCCIFDEKHLRYLSEMIQERFKIVYYQIHTIDGADYELDSLDDIISYGNLDTRRIIQLDIFGSNEERYNRFLSDISVSLYDISEQDGMSAYLRLNNQEEKDIVFYSQMMEEFVKSARVSYWWIFKDIIQVLLTVFLALFLYFLFEGFSFNSQESLHVFLLMLGVASFISIMGGTKLLLKCLFQQGGFLIGIQIKRAKKRIKKRNFILSSILVTLVLGVISGVIVHYLFP